MIVNNFTTKIVAKKENSRRDFHMTSILVFYTLAFSGDVLFNTSPAGTHH